MDSTIPKNEIDLPDEDDVRAAEVERAFVLRQSRAVSMLKASIPSRFADAKLKSFKVTRDKQKAVLSELCEICRKIEDFCSGSHQLFVWGKIGTGKDHLSIAVAKQAAMKGYSCRWIDAAEWFGRVNDWHTRERAFAEAITPDVIILSDPVCSRRWSESRAEQEKRALRQLANDRWYRNKATWVTVNVSSLHGSEPSSAKSMMIGDTLDRLLDGAAVVHCDWDSHRARRSWNGKAEHNANGSTSGARARHVRS